MGVLKHACIVCLLAIPLIMGCGGEKDRQGAHNQRDLQRRFDALVPDLLARHSIAGVSIAVIDKGQVAWTGGYGLADRKASTPVTEHTLFNIGSVSKVVTAWGVMALIEDSAMMDLDSPVERYLTRWHIPESNFDVNQVTFRRLLSHTSGFSVLPASESFTYPPFLEETLSRSYGSFGRLRLVRRPGSEFQYNNGNYVLLQLLIEEVARTDFITFIHRTVLGPLEMKHSTYAPESEQVATPYDESGNAVPQYQNKNFAGSGGLYSTASDLARLVAVAMQTADGEVPGRGVLRPETVRRMISPTEESGGNYGLGYKIIPISDDLTMIGHDGANPGWFAYFMASPEHGIGIVVLTNGSHGGRIVADIVCTWANWEESIELSGLCKGPKPIPAK